MDITALSNLLQESEPSNNQDNVENKINTDNSFLTPASIGNPLGSKPSSESQSTSLPFYLQPAIKKEKNNEQSTSGNEKISVRTNTLSTSVSSLGPVGIKSSNLVKSAEPANSEKNVDDNKGHNRCNDIWNDESGEIPNEEQILCEHDGRPSPKFQFYYKQNVGTEDVFLGMSDISPSSYDCTHLVVKIFFPGEKMKDIDLDVTKRRISAQSTKFKLFTYLPVPVDFNEGSAKFDSKKEILIVTLPILLDEM